MMIISLVTSGLKWPQPATSSFSEMQAMHNDESSKQLYHSPELFFHGYAADLIWGRIECESKQAAKRVRRLIDEFNGSLSFSPAKECQKLQVDLPLVSRQFKNLYRI